MSRASSKVTDKVFRRQSDLKKMILEQIKLAGAEERDVLRRWRKIIISNTHPRWGNFLENISAIAHLCLELDIFDQCPVELWWEEAHVLAAWSHRGPISCSSETNASPAHHRWKVSSARVPEQPGAWHWLALYVALKKGKNGAWFQPFYVFASFPREICTVLVDLFVLQWYRFCTVKPWGSERSQKCTILAMCGGILC